MLIFIYDLLMTKDYQKLTGIDLEFVCYAKTYARTYWIDDSKKKRRFTVYDKKKSMKTVYGALFHVKDYEKDKHRLHSIYNNSIPFTAQTHREDLYDFVEIQAFPIKFKALQDFLTNNVVVGEPIRCMSFVGNLSNAKVKKYSKTSYHRCTDIDKDNFITLIKENNKVKENDYGLE